MITQVISIEKCANLTQTYEGNLVTTVETVILSILLAYILLLNLSVAVVTIGSAELRGCLISMQLAATYVGNILGGISLIGNDIYHSRAGVLPICQKGVERYTVLYFGISMNMVILLFNTRYRYVGISNIKQMSSMRNVPTINIVLKVWIPTVVASAIICVTATLVVKYVIDYQFIISMGICIIPITIAILWNGLLSRRLKTSRQVSKCVNRQASVQLLDRATFIVNATLVAHVVFLFLCTIATVCSILYYEQIALLVALSWLLRLLYFLLFVIEGQVYLIKVKPARDILKDKITRCICCFKRTQTLEFEGENINLHATQTI